MNPLALMTNGLQSSVPAPVIVYPLIAEVDV
jgi:hypothetical protein